MRSPTLIAAILTAVLLIGCGTVSSKSSKSPQEGFGNTYTGVKSDVKSLERMNEDSRFMLSTPLFFIVVPLYVFLGADLVFSTIADTVLLPVDLILRKPQKSTEATPLESQ